MRTRGGLAEMGRHGRNDHVCCHYARERESRAAVEAFVADGVALHQRICFVTRRDRARVVDDLAWLGATGSPHSADTLLSEGSLVVVPPEAVYDLEMPLDPERQLATYTAAVEAALADGYSGLRVVSDITELVSDPARRAGHVRCELKADQYMAAGQVFSAMCTVDGSVLGSDEVADIAAVHPVVAADTVPDGALGKCRLFFDGPRLVLAGVLDSYNSEQVAGLLRASGIRGPEVVTLDLRGLEFIDGHGLHALARWSDQTAGQDGRVVIEGASPLTRRMWTLLGFEVLTGVEFAGTTP